MLKELPVDVPVVRAIGMGAMNADAPAIRAANEAIEAFMIKQGIRLCVKRHRIIVLCLV